MTMKKLCTLFLVACLVTELAAPLRAQLLYKQASAPIDQRVSDLLSRMTLTEKVGQLCCPLGWEMYEKTSPHSVRVSALFKERMKSMPIGSFWAVLRADPWTQKTLETGLTPELSAKALNEMQRYAVEETRLGIPILFAEECPHGHMAIGTTVFPTSLALGSTWNTDLMHRTGEAIALEARSEGANIGYGPVIDVSREPRWSRMEESFGEDPVLTATLGVELMKGMQGASRSDGCHLYSTLKHFAGYGMPVGGHNGERAHIGLRELMSEYLHPFRKAVEAGATTVMTSYNSIDGIPSTSNAYLLQDVLRNQWGFRGFVYSDLGSIEGIATSHHVAGSIKEAATLALQAGVDMDLGGNAYGKNLETAVKEGRLDMRTIDQAVARILRLKFEMGLFENPYVDPKRAKQVVRSQAHRDLACEVARQGIVLLKNDGLLPLSKGLKHIAVIGPNADEIYNQLGDYTAPQAREAISTVLDGIREVVGADTQVSYVKGCAVRDVTQSKLQEACEVARTADVVVLVVGGSSARDFKTQYQSTGAATVVNESDRLIPDMDCGEGYDRKTLSLLGDQERLMQLLIETGKPLVVVYIQGRPLDMTLASEKANALLTAWYPGEQGGRAVADILFGHYNPAGRLPVSIPRNEGQLPVYYSQGKQRDYVEGTAEPLYVFGYGLSYTTFSYDDLQIRPGGGDGALQTISVRITNTGEREGDEVVQLYLRDCVSSVSQPPIQLKAFRRIHLKCGESQVVRFALTEDDLSLYNVYMERVVEPGEFEVFVGASSNDIRLRGNFVVD